MRLRGGVLSSGLRWSEEQDEIARNTSRQVRFLSIMYYAVAVSSCLGLVAISLRTSYGQLSGASNSTAVGAYTMVNGHLTTLRLLHNYLVSNKDNRMMMMIWVLALCGLVGRCQRFGETYCRHLQGY
jgi:hypothetical protein